MSIPLRYRRHQGLPGQPGTLQNTTSAMAAAASYSTSPVVQPHQAWQGHELKYGDQYAQAAARKMGQQGPHYLVVPSQKTENDHHHHHHHHHQAHHQVNHHSNSNFASHHGSPSIPQHSAMPNLLSSNMSAGGSPVISQAQQSPSLGQQIPRKARPYNRADRTMGRIVDGEYQEPNQSAIDKLIASTAPHKPVEGAEFVDAKANTKANAPLRQRTSHQQSPIEECTVNIRLPSRQVAKRVSMRLTVKELITQLVKEHRLEFEFEHNNEGDGDDIILWESIEGIRRPLRPTESIGPIVYRWGNRASRCYFRTTSTALRNDVDSLASLVPRRDMLRNPPKILAADVSFSRPSVLYNPHVNNYIQPRSPPMSPPPEHSSDQSFKSSSKNETSNGGGSKNGQLARVPSKLNPNDKCLAAKRVQADNDDIALQTQLVWGFGSLQLDNGKLALKQKPGDEIVCVLDIHGTDVYEWPHTGPKKYVLVLRAQQINSRSVYISTDSAKTFNVLRNAVYTARSKELLAVQLRMR